LEARYGDGNQIAWLFLALVRAAGIPADPVIPTRDVHFLTRRHEPRSKFHCVVTLDGKDYF
jgi:hypothetical protein